MDITQHFALEEFACHNGTAYPAEWIDERLRPLCAVLEAIRAALGGKPITILSGYRTGDYNESLRNSDGSGTGVAKDSMHIQGRAADIAVESVAPSDVHRAVLELFKDGKLADLGGCGLYQGWCHVDIRERPENGHLAQWNGPGVSAPITALTAAV